MTTKLQNEALWRAIDNYFKWLTEREECDYEMNNPSWMAYSDCCLRLTELLREEELYTKIDEI